MQAQESPNILRDLGPDEQRVALAVGIILDRVRRLPPEDSDDLFELLKEFHNANSKEDLRAADAAIMEILEQRPVKVRRLLLERNDRAEPGELQSWVDWVSKQIHDRRTQAGLTQAELAERSGLPQSHISRIENAKLSPSHFTLEKLAKALGVHVGEFDPSTNT